ncbi:MAG: nicotinate phosphoribosyltransferase [Propionibacteriaceae bacterium]|jgi:nicotinate phosphoribosyltransferase|nr:nicotinate phosphoribosyltransferase [Propionibacteriaceae bacterium]
MTDKFSRASTALLTDEYELTMVRAALRSGMAERRSVFELFARRLPSGRRYGVVAGVGRALDAIERFRFEERELDFLHRAKVIDDVTADYLTGWRFQGSIWGYGEGELYFPGSPLVIVEGSFAESVVLETILLSIYNYDSAVASAASRMTLMAEDRPCIEMGSRRIHEWAAVAAARAAYVAGFASSSNMEAGLEYGIPTSGTAAHSFTLLHDSEEEAFQAQIDTLGEDTTLLVDTYDIESAVRLGVKLTKGRLGAVRIDSGDLRATARDVRALLDELGANQTRIIVTSDLDEWQLAALSGAPVDGYGVGTALVTGSGAPTCSMVYKLVAHSASDQPDAAMIAVAKKSASKATMGGRKFAMRQRNSAGTATAELIGVGAPVSDDGNDRVLLRQLVRDGEIVGRESLDDARARHLMARAELPPDGTKMSRGEPAIATYYLDPNGQIMPTPYGG